VGYATGELPDGFHLLGLTQLRLEREVGPFDQLALNADRD
jgi:hypothetical protein